MYIKRKSFAFDVPKLAIESATNATLSRLVYTRKKKNPGP